MYTTWKNMIQRTTNSNAPAYANYGGRGISVCDEWLNSYQAFENYMGARPEGATVDRIDNDGNYEPGNVRWATKIEQHNNTRNNVNITYKGITQTIAQWSRELGINDKRLSQRLIRGWSVDRAFTQPVKVQTELIFNHNNETKTLLEWSKKIGIKYNTLTSRLDRGWTVERALTEPAKTHISKEI